MSVAINEVLDDLRLYAPGAPEPVLVRAYIHAVRRMAEHARVWRSDDVGVTQTVDDGVMNLRPGSDAGDAEVYDAVYVMYQDDVLKKASDRQMAGLKGSKPAAYRIRPNRLFFAPKDADIDEDLFDGLFILRPARNAEFIDEELVDEFKDQFERGALARLLAQPGQTWTSFDGAEFYEQMFRSDMDYWQSRAADDFMTGVPRKVRYGGY